MAQTTEVLMPVSLNCCMFLSVRFLTIVFARGCEVRHIVDFEIIFLVSNVCCSKFLLMKGRPFLVVEQL